MCVGDKLAVRRLKWSLNIVVFSLFISKTHMKFMYLQNNNYNPLIYRCLFPNGSLQDKSFWAQWRHMTDMEVVITWLQIVNWLWGLYISTVVL